MKDQQQLQNDRPIQREIAVVTAFGVVLVVLHGVAFVWSTIELIFFRLLSTTLHQWLSSFFLHPSPASRPRNVPIAVSSQRFRGSPPMKKQDSVGFSCMSLRCSLFFSLHRFSSSGRGTTKAKGSCSSITPYADLARTGLPSRRSTSIQLHVARFFGTEGQSGNWVVVV